MIQFETVKYGILKAKDNHRKDDSNSSDDEFLLPETNGLTGGDLSYDQKHLDNEKELFPSNTEISKPLCILSSSTPTITTTDIKMDTTEVEPDDIDYHEHSDNEETERISNGGDEKMTKHNEDAANNNGRDRPDTEVDDEKVDAEHSAEHPDGGYPQGYYSLEALQKMSQVVSAAMGNSSENEDAQKQLAVLQSTLFTLQHQQLFQLQLIQQLQSQLSINRPSTSNSDDNDCDDEEDEREEGELTEEQMAEEQRKYEEEQAELRKIEEEKRIKAKLEGGSNLNDGDDSKPLNPNSTAATSDSLSAMEASFSSSFASTIITNHDQPSSMDGLNSLEMLQKRAEEVLDSASRGILSGSLTDEMSFKNDGKGRNEPFFKHRCRYCGKVFGSDSALQIHIRSHTGERPFKCNVCGSRFTTKGNLKVHFQRHTQKFPHIHMNPNPIPEHLDKFYPPLLPPLPPGQQPPLSPPPPSSARPSGPMSLPFPPIPGLPPGLQAFQGMSGLPLFRPPFDLLKQMGAHPFFGAMREAAQLDAEPQSKQSEPVRSPEPTPKQSSIDQNEQQDIPADLSKPTDLSCAIVKEEPKDEPVSTPPLSVSPLPPPPPPLPEKSHVKEPMIQQSLVEMEEQHEHQQQQLSPHQQPLQKPIVEELIRPKHRSVSPKPWKDDKKDCISPAKSIDDLPMPRDQPENLSAKINAKLSPSSIGSMRECYFNDHPHEMRIFPSMLPRPGSTDNSWESYIEVDKSSETSKLQQLVDNIENKITDPNECCVCHKVLSCRSALQMHYRTHTGERPFRCKICGRAFTTKGNLKTHMSVHRMKPPMRTIHQCPVCHKKYSNSLVLQQHIRLHTGEPIDLTLEQIQAAEIRDFPSLSPGTFPMGINPFAFHIPGLHPGAMGPESSNGDNDDFMDEDFDDGSNFDENMSNAGSMSGDSNQNISNLSRTNADEHHTRAISAMLAEHSKSVENLSRAPSTTSHIESVEEKCSSPRTPPPQSASPAPSDISQGALDLTPRSEPKLSPPSSTQTISQGPPSGAMGTFPNFPFMPHVTSASSPMMSNALNSLAQSVAPMGPFNPMALAGIRGNTTCKICLKTFACQSALEIHYRSHTKERPYKCSICDKAFTTKNEELIHTSLHFQIYGNMKQHMMTHKLQSMPQHMFGNQSGPIAMDTQSMSPEPKEQPVPVPPPQSMPINAPIRVKTESELSPRPIVVDGNSRGSNSSINNNNINMPNQDRHDRRERSMPIPPFQADTNYQVLLERQQQQHHQQQQQQQQQQQMQQQQMQQQQQQHQQIKNEIRLKRSPTEIDQPSPKRPLVSETHTPSAELPVVPNMKDAFHMPPQHLEDKTSSHLERLQQFHTSSLLNQPLKMESHLKATSSPGSDMNASGDQKHYCHLCQKNFSSTSSLQIHMRTHTGERPFVCNVCQKAFTTKGNLKVHMGIHTWSGASRRGRRMSLELPFNGSMPLMLQNPDFLQRHSDFFHPYPPSHLLGRMQQSMNMEHSQKFDRGAPPPILNLAHKYMNSNGINSGHSITNHTHDGSNNRPPPYVNNNNSSSSTTPPSPLSDKQTSPNSLRDEIIMESPKRNGDLSPTRTVTPDLSPRLWKLHYESKAVNRDNLDGKNDKQSKAIEELIA